MVVPASGVGLRKILRPIRAQWERGTSLSVAFMLVTCVPGPGRACVLVNPAAPPVSLCTVDIYSRIHSNETQAETAEFCRSPQHAHSMYSVVNHIPFLQRTPRCFILTFRRDQPRGRCLGTEKHSKKNKTLWTEFFPPRLNIKRPESGCFSKHDEGDSNYTHSSGDGLMGVQLLSTMLDIKSETISFLKKLSRCLNWHQETRAGLFSLFLI